MKKIKSIILFMCLTIVLIINSSVMVFANETNTRVISTGVEYYGITNSNNNYNYYKFTTKSKGYIDINISKHQDVRYDYELLNENSKLYGSWSTGYGSGTSTVRMGVPSGTYYIRVNKYYSSDKNTQYKFSVNATASSYWELEENDSFDKANKISLGKTYNGITDSRYSYDYYKFTVPSKGYVDINFKQNTDVRYDYELLNENLQSYGSWSTEYGSGTSTVRMGIPSGTYYIRVNKYYSSDKNTQYKFLVNATASSYWESEENDSFDKANKILLGKTYNGITDSRYSYDYYKFTVPSKGYVDINFKQNTDVRYDYELLNENSQSYGSWSTEYGSGTSTVRMGIPSGTYYIRVNKYYSSDKNTQYSFCIGKRINTFTVNNINNRSTTITGKGLSGATVKAYVDGKQIGKSVKVSTNGNYNIAIPKQKIGKKIILKISKENYITKEISTTVLKTFTTFTVNSIKTTSTSISGKGLKNSSVKAYVDGKQIGKTVKVSSSGAYKINISKQKKGKKVVVKMSNSGYETIQKAITVK